jgi:ATPase family protein associated with various cellular activities (AAA)/winged helix domain-containing protein
MSERTQQWQQDSRQTLETHLARIREYLERSAEHSETSVAAAPDEPSARGALDVLVEKFSLSDFERDALLVCAGVEFDAGFARLMARIRGEDRRYRPTFSLLFSLLAEPHWSAIAPDGPLRSGRLLLVGDGPGLTASPLRIEESVLHFLTGLPQVGEELRALVRPLPPPQTLAPGHRKTSEMIVQAWSRQSDDGRRRLVRLVSADAREGRLVFASASHSIGFAAFVIDASVIPRSACELDDVASVWERDAVLNDFALLVDLTATTDPEARRAASQLTERLHGLAATVGENVETSPAIQSVRIDLAPPRAAEQVDIWRSALGDECQSLNGQIGRLVQQFSLPASAIFESAQQLRLVDANDPAAAGRALWLNCRQHARGGMDDLAQRIDARAYWEDLVLPPSQLQTLRHIAVQVRQRHRVYESWGFAGKSVRGLGVSALFWGPSGTGKTMASEVLANELELDVYRIDLSATVSKYIGETEKNLRRIFDAAEASGAILVIDEADALFGKRSEVKDSHDRYANLEISYLLQRMEAYRGLAILTTNLKSALDHAFLRRLRFVVQFPFPGPVERQAVWRSVFPADTPRAELDYEKLSRLSVTGGNIANIALDAAFRAAEDNEPVTMQHLLLAARAEYGKLEKPLSDSEIRGWA